MLHLVLATGIGNMHVLLQWFNMSKYRVVDTSVNINEGNRIQISKDQAHRRRHALAEAGGGWYVVTKGVQFKNGETFSLTNAIEKVDVRKVELVTKKDDVQK